MAVNLRAVGDRPEQSDARAGSTETPADMESDMASDQIMIAERYELLGRIGHGATGTVYRAFDRTLDRQVALKLLHPGELEVAEREAQVLAKVTHRNVVTIHDFGQSGGHRYLVLELLEGRDFRAWLRERPPAAEIVANFVEAGRGLSAAHRAGLVHRDFKPSNVILTNSGRVVVIDFGLARNLDSLAGELEPVRFAEGTLAYMAPERLAGYENDERGDQFAFCVALWEALTGSNPFAGDDPLARYRSIRNGPARVNLRVSKPIVAGLERGMSFERADRFSTMDELLRELDRPVDIPERRRARPVLTAIAVAGTFFIGWGLTPENPTIDEAYSSLDPTIEVGLAMLDSAHKRAADGDHTVALEDLLEAAELVMSLKSQRGSEDFCTFGAAVPKLADDFVKADAHHQAAVAYAVAARFAQDCPTLDIAEMRIQKEAAQSRMVAQPRPDPRGPASK